MLVGIYLIKRARHDSPVENTISRVYLYKYLLRPQFHTRNIQDVQNNIEIISFFFLTISPILLFFTRLIYAVCPMTLYVHDVIECNINRYVLSRVTRDNNTWKISK